MNVTITKLAENKFSAVTNLYMSDGTFRTDYCMALNGAVLRSRNEKGYVRVDGALRFNLGPKSLAAVQALAIGESFTIQA